ncbi:MAG TPA: conjugal transfer protein TrbL family protein [Ruminiclostridium sp.]|nr:conjugal transfer protein TrbL family protein [Ruminiclostridium sp.]
MTFNYGGQKEGRDVLDKLFELLFKPIVSHGANWLGNMFSGLAETTLRIENSISVILEKDAISESVANGTITQAANVLSTALSKIQVLCLSMAVAMIILKFLKKGFEAYVLWTEGDADADPLLLATSFFKALAIAMAFPVLYGYVCDITSSFSEAIRNACGVTSEFSYGNIGGLLETGLFELIGCLVAVIMFIILYVQFIKRGFEMYILRMAFPIGCVGLLDSDRAMYKAMTQVMLQCCATIVVQVGLSQLALSIVFTGHPIIGTAAILAALGTPKFLQHFMVPSGGGFNSGTVYQTARVFQMAKGVLAKG